MTPIGNSSRPMDILGLPQFKVLEVRSQRPNGDVEVVGVLSHLRGVRNDSGWLYRTNGPSIIGNLDAVPTSAGAPIIFVTPDASLAPELGAGITYPWVDGSWQAYHIGMILGPTSRWTHRTFRSGAAHYFKLNGATGWQPIGEPIPNGAEDLGVREGAWDHEHCEICGERIGSGGVADGYSDAEDHWLCASCYTRFAMTHDVSFALE